MATRSPSALHATAFNTLATVRSMIGVAALFHPSLACDTFGIEMNHGSRILARLLGARECAISVLLWWASRNARFSGDRATAESDKSQDRAKNNLKLLLWTGMAIDAIDSVSSAVSIWEGSMGGKAIWFVGVGALGFVGLGGVALGTI